MFLKVCALASLPSEQKAAGSVAERACSALGEWVKWMFSATCLQTPVAILRRGSWDFMQSCISRLGKMDSVQGSAENKKKGPCSSGGFC